VFRFTKDDVSIYQPETELTSDDMHTSGANLAAIRLNASAVAKVKGVLPDVEEIIGDVPDLETYDDTNFDDTTIDAQITVSGYPE
jgi:hypothetical protein